MKNRGLLLGTVYFIIHLLVEVICFSFLGRKVGVTGALLLTILFDFLAFVPQGLIGVLNAVRKKLDIGTMGVLLMLGGILIWSDTAAWRVFLGIALIALGNAFLHECGAVATVVNGEGKLFPGALFVAGGSFGVVTGKFLSGNAAIIPICLISLTVIEILVLLTNRYWLYEDVQYPEYHLVRPEVNADMVIFSVVLITAVRSFLAYAIPISWNKEWWQSFLLFFLMGMGKAVGGWCSDRFGARETGVVSSLLSIPFLVWGDKMMVVSIVGVFLFSMTMSITFGMALSVPGMWPGVAFGVTTIGLFLGLMPVMITGHLPLLVNDIIVVVFSIIAAYFLWKLCRKKDVKKINQKAGN